MRPRFPWNNQKHMKNITILIFMPLHWRGTSQNCPPPFFLFSARTRDEGVRGVLSLPIWLSYFWVRWHYQCPTLFSVQLQSLSGLKSYELIVDSSITRTGRVSLIADINSDSVTFPLNILLRQAQWELMFGLSLGSGQTEIIMLISSARLGLELSLARSTRHFFAQTLA